jgi:hypothetical protein
MTVQADSEFGIDRLEHMVEKMLKQLRRQQLSLDKARFMETKIAEALHEDEKESQDYKEKEKASISPCCPKTPISF